VKAGGGKIMTIGEMVKAFMLKLEWFDTRFPRIPVNVQVSFKVLGFFMSINDIKHIFDPICQDLKCCNRKGATLFMGNSLPTFKLGYN